ncbi:hypothetical protein BJ742DRAFT_766052 [Cladochytrium replicatum]|nr:hypothetical protein BJ742DRAFT_766052 [Cladochytrium replicatum]
MLKRCVIALLSLPLSINALSTQKQFVLDAANSGVESVRCPHLILGAGAAGLYAALQLTERYGVRGSDICIIESDPEWVGGRVRDVELVPGVEPVGLGAWRVESEHTRAWELMRKYNIDTYPWPKSATHFQARGVFTESMDDLRKTAFPRLPAFPEGKDPFSMLAEMLSKEIDKIGPQLPLFVTFRDVITRVLGSEAYKFLLATAMGYHGFFEIPLDVTQMFVRRNPDEEDGPPNTTTMSRPFGGMSAITGAMHKEALSSGVRFYLGSTVTEIENGSWLDPGRFSVTATRGSRARKFFGNVVFNTITPLAFDRIKGSIPTILKSHPEFKSIGANIMFKSAMSFSHAWWEHEPIKLTPDGILATDLNCLQAITPMRGRGPNGEAVLHTSYSDGQCAMNHWRTSVAIFNSTEMREHLLMQLREVFDPVVVPEPIDIVYWIWNDGATHHQLPHSGVSMERLEEWGTTAPIAGEAIYMIGEAYGSSKGWMEPALESAALAVDHYKGHPRVRVSKSGNVLAEVLKEGGPVRLEVRKDVLNMLS